MRGRKVEPRQIETLKQIYAETGSIAEAARQAGLSRSTAFTYVKSEDEFEQVRTEKRLDIIDEIAEARRLYLAHLSKPDVISRTEAKDAATVMGILIDKHQLLTGRATERRENLNVDGAREDLKRRINEMARRRQEGGEDLKVI